MYFELQLSAAVFARVIRNRLRALPLGLDLSLPDQDNGELVVDQVQIGDATSVQREMAADNSGGSFKAKLSATQLVRTLSPMNLSTFTVPYVQVRQEIRILLVRASVLEANGPVASPPTLKVTIFPVFNVSLTALNQTQGGGPLVLTYALAYVEFGPVALQLDDAQRAYIAQVTGGLTIASSVVDLGAMTAFMKRPVFAINAGIACDQDGTRVALRVDFDIHASPIAVDRAFFEAGPVDLLYGKDWAMLMDAEVLLQEAQPRIKQALDDMANMRTLVEPVATWEPAEATLRVTAAVRLIGACPGIGADIDMDVRLDLGARFSVPVPNHLLVHYRLDSGMIDADQVFGCALTAALLYPFAGAALLEAKKIDLKDFLGGIAFGPYFTIGQLVGVIMAQKLEDDISDSLGDTCHKLDDANYECTSIVDLVIRLVPTLNSRFLLDWVHGVPQGLVLSGVVLGLGELFVATVGDLGVRPFKWQVLGHCTGNGKNNFRVGNEATVFVPGVLVSARVLADPQHGYALAFRDSEITITPANPPVPYDSMLRVITTHGVRTITFKAARPMSSEESKALQTALLGAGLTCYYWEKNFTAKEKILWRVDPAFDVDPENGLRQWHVLVQSVQPGSTLTVSTPAGENVFVGRPSRNGAIHFSLMFPDHGGPDELVFELERDRGSEPLPLEVSVRQTLYGLRATLPVQGDVRNIEVGGSLRQPQLEIATRRQHLRWDVRNSLAPQLLQATERDAAVEGDTRVLHCGSRVGGSVSVALDRALERLVGQLGRAHALGSPRILGVAEALYLRTDRGASVYEVDAPEGPTEIHMLPAPGWYENTVASMNLLARHDRARQVVELYEVAGRRIV